MKAFGVRVKQLRRGRNLTHEQPSELLHISVSHLRKIEIGYNAPSIEPLLSMAELFGVITDHLLRMQTFTQSKCEPSLLGHKLWRSGAVS